MANRTSKPEKKKTVATLTHEEASRKNIPTAEFQSVMQKNSSARSVLPSSAACPGSIKKKARRNRDLDPQLVGAVKTSRDWSDLVTHAPPLYIQGKGSSQGPDRRPAAA